MQEVGFKEAGELLNTPVSTLRRWVVLLEEQGYTFNRDGKRRQLDWQDVGVLREVKLSLQERALEEAIQKAIFSVATQEGLHQQETLSLIKGSEWETFESHINGLKESLFWNGQEQAVSTLLTAWRALQETIGGE
ncbi:hypothetical protein [Paenibacillus sp. FSL H3-0469]|uniref:hypothetical protein n=1 Tax=Paenibacillus sp. FSL H3-0469 TaxID=2954506 RepID=UPI003100AA9F